jgi:hypothetical protein
MAPGSGEARAAFRVRLKELMREMLRVKREETIALKRVWFEFPSSEQVHERLRGRRLSPAHHPEGRRAV